MSRQRKGEAPLLPRIEAIDFAPAGTLAGDFVAGSGSARMLLAPNGVTRGPAGTGESAGAVGPNGADGPGGGHQARQPQSPLPERAFTAASDGAAAKLALILAGEGELVSTGQQPGLFLGPLYSLYKAITAIRVAEERERRTGRPTLALFWVAADDHDWDEVAACRLLDPDEELIELRLEPPPGREERSVGETPLPASVAEAIARLRSCSRGPATGAPAPWFGDLEAAYQPGATFAAAFIRGMAGALAGHDIVLLDSSDPFVRRAASGLYRSVLEAPDRVTTAMADGRTRLEDAGYTPGLTPPAAGLQIFFDAGADAGAGGNADANTDADAGRRHVLAADGGFDLGDGEAVDRAALAALLTERPESFTPAAALRPVLESRLLPVAATVLGPGEMGYWAQLPPLFSALGVPFPVVHPRDNWLLVEAAVDHMLSKLGLVAADVADRGDELPARWIDGARPPAVAAALEGAEAELRSAFERLGDAAAAEIPGLRSAVARASHEAGKAMSGLTKTIDAHVAERESIALGQVQRLNTHLRPGGNRQERIITSAQFLCRYGEGLVEALMASSRVAGAEGRG